MQAKCRICGGLNTLEEGQITVQCGYCGSDVTVPHTSDERILAKHNRASELRLAQEFDKAQMMYEAIVQDRPDDVEAYFNIALCRFGVEYVKDPATGERKPTLHRMQFASILTDENYQHAVEHADPVARRLYQQDGDRIDQIQKEFLRISSQEKPFDVFICYKEKDDHTHQRTADSVYAQEIYDALTGEGYNVFFARITLEDKLGEAYEPYIFAALNSAKVMLVVGTSAEHMQARWVRNEWKRFLYLMKNNRDMRLIPVYRDMQADDMPEEFTYLQAQDYGKIGALQDLVRGVRKILGAKATQRVERSTEKDTHANVNALLRRAELFLEDSEFDNAGEYYDRVLDQDPECAEAYMGKAAIDYKQKKLSDLSRMPEDISQNPNIRKAQRFAKGQKKETFDGWVKKTVLRKTYRKAAQTIGLTALKKDNAAESLVQRKQKDDPAGFDSKAYEQAASLFEQVKTFADAQACMHHCRALAKIAAKDADYQAAVADYLRIGASPTLDQIKAAAERMDAMGDYAPAKKQAELLRNQYDERLAHECTQLHTQIWRNTEYDAVRFDSYAQQIRALPQDDERVQKLFKDLEECKRRLTGKWVASDEDVSNAKVNWESGEEPKTGFGPALSDEDQRAINERIFHDAGSDNNSSQGKKKKAKKKRGCLHFLFFKLFVPAALIFSFLYFDGVSWAYQNLPRDIRRTSAAQSVFSVLYDAHDALVDRLGEPDGLLMNVRVKLYELTSEYLPQIADRFALSDSDYYSMGIGLLAADDYRAAVRAFEQAAGYSDALSRAYDIRDTYLHEYKIAGTVAHVLVNAQDGTVTGLGAAALTNVSGWKDVRAVSVSDSHSLGLRSDGTVQIVSKLFSVETPTEKWTDVVAIAAGDYHTVGLKNDGTLVAAGLNTHKQCNISGWTNVVAIAAGDLFTLGLTREGDVLLAGSYSAVSNSPTVTGWTDIVAIAAGDTHVVGLKKDGTVVCEGTNSAITRAVKGWTDIVAVDAGANHVVGLKADGTLVAAGSGACCDVDAYQGVVSTVADADFTAVFYADGTADIAGDFDY